MAGVMDRLRQRHAHDPRRGDRAIEPSELHHVDDRAHAPALGAHAPGECIRELDLGRCVRAIAELVLQALQAQCVDGSIGRKAGHQETGEPLRRLRQHQQAVAHGRRHEPLVADDGVALARRLGARGVGTHVGAALLLGHAHAERDARLVRPRHEARIVAARKHLGHKLARQRRLGRERRDRCARHGDRTEVTGLDLRRHVEARRTQHLGRRRRGLDTAFR